MFIENHRASSSVMPSGPMADIAFLLLIFFLVVTAISTDKGIHLTLPPTAITNILINDAGDCLVNNEICRIHHLGDIVELKIMRNDKMIDSIKSSPASSYKVFLAVLDQLKTAAVTKISIADSDK